MLTSWKRINWVQHTDGSPTGTLNSLCCPTPLGYSCVWHRETIIHNHATHRAEKEIEREGTCRESNFQSSGPSLFQQHSKAGFSDTREKTMKEREREKGRDLSEREWPCVLWRQNSLALHQNLVSCFAIHYLHRQHSKMNQIQNTEQRQTCLGSVYIVGILVTSPGRYFLGILYLFPSTWFEKEQ